jgi:predicted lipoprotein with Yx(FWY)xxD motif
MTRPRNEGGTGRGPSFKALLVAVFAGLAVAALAGLAFAKTSSKTLQSAHNSALNKTIVVTSKGLTLYELRPETTKHLLCNTQTCFGFWPPLKVSKHAKLSAATGIKGKLGLLHRDGFYQVTLGGHPLYRFGGDHNKKGQANGNGIKLNGGTWGVVAASAAKGANTTTTTTTTSTTSTTSTSTYTNPYGH